MICPNCKKNFSLKITNEQRLEIISRYKNGETCRGIAKTIGGVSFSTVSRITKEYQTLINLGLLKRQ